MYLSYHGGACCGVKHVWGLPSQPNYPTGALEGGERTGGGVSRLYTLPCPRETGEERLDRHIRFLERSNPWGILEIICNESTGLYGSKQNSNWREALKARGFNEVSVSKNSNTVNTIHVWHKVFDEDIKKKAYIFDLNEEIRAAENIETVMKDIVDPFAAPDAAFRPAQTPF